MAALFASGRIVDLIVVIVLIEAAALCIVRARTRHGPDVLDTLSNLAAGLFLLLALRAALEDASWHWIAAALSAAGVSHLVHQLRRWRS